MAWNKFKKKYLILTALILVVIFLLFLTKIVGIIELDANKIKYKNIEIKGKNIVSEVVFKPIDLYRGLSNRESLCADCGMLFVFPDKQKRTFVMRNMKFSLDIVFIDDNKIINIASDLPPEGANPSNDYASSDIANYVLELPGGFCQKNNIVAGDTIKINN